jgi:hypothetical protein
MKKILIFAALFVAMASFGLGGTAVLAHAQTAPAATASPMSPSDQAALEQQLQVAKAELIQLETQAGQVPAGDNTSAQPAMATSPVTVTLTVPASGMTPSNGMTLSATDISDINGTLSALAGVLVSLQTKLTQDPQFATTNGPAVVAQLQAIGNTLGGVIASMSTGGSSNIAMGNSPSQAATAPATAPSAGSSASAGNAAGSDSGSAGSGAGIAQTTPTAPVAGSNANGNTSAGTAGTPAAAAPIVPQTAQASSSFSFSKLNWPLIIVIVLIIAAIAIWLWWDDSEDTKQPTVKTTSPAPQRPVQVVTMSNQMNGSNPSQQSSTPASPLSSAMGSQDPKRKPA